MATKVGMKSMATKVGIRKKNIILTESPSSDFVTVQFALGEAVQETSGFRRTHSPPCCKAGAVTKGPSLGRPHESLYEP